MKTTFYILGACLLLLMVSCDLEDPNEGVPANQVFTLTTDQATIPADSNSSLILKVNLGELSDVEQMVTFTTEAGTFAGADPSDPQMRTVTTIQGEAEAELLSGNEVIESVRVFAQVGEFQQDTVVGFERALPSLIKFRADKNVVTADRIDFATLTLEVFRNDEESVPSTGLLVNFQQLPLDTAMADVEPFEFTSGNRLTTRVSSLNGDPGEVGIEVAVPGENGTLRDTIFLLFEE